MPEFRMSRRPDKVGRWILPGGGVLAAVLTVAALTYVAYRHEATVQSDAAFKEMAAVLDLKRESIQSWLWDRRADAHFLTKSVRFGRELEAMVARREPIRDSALINYLSRAVSPYSYWEIYGLGPLGGVAFELRGGETASRRPIDLARWAIERVDTVFSPLHGEIVSGRSVLTLDIAVPLFSEPDGTPVGSVVLRIDAGAHFLPLVWRMDDALSLTTYLARREGGKVLRWLEGADKGGPVETSDASLALHQALEGSARRIVATDFRGERVLAKARPVAGSDWFLVATRNEAELEAPALRVAFAVGGLLTFVLAGGGALATMRWRYRTRAHAQQLHLERLERDALEKHFDWSTKYARDIVLLRDAEMRIVQCNDAALAAYGYSLEEMRDLPPGNLRAPEQRASFEADHRNAQRTGDAIFETQHCGKDGRVFSVEVSTRAFEIEGRRYYHSVIRDITERKRGERLAALEHAIARRLAKAESVASGLRRVIRTICKSEHWVRGSYWEADETTGVLRFGAAWSLPGSGLERYAEASRSVVFAPGVGLAGRVWQTGEPLWSADFGNDARVVQKDLASATGLRGCFAFPVFAESKAIGVLVFFSREIREPDARLLDATRAIGRQVGQFVLRKLAEVATRASESRFRAIAELSLDAHVVADHAGKIVSWNPAAERLFQHSGAQAIGQPLCILMPPEYRARHEAGLARLSAGGSSTMMGKRIELRGLRRDGVEFPLELALATWGSGSERYYSGVLRDLTERKAAERRIDFLTRLYATLSQVNTAIVHSRSEEELFDRICRAVVEHGEMLGAIVRMADVEGRQLRAVAHSESMRSVVEQGAMDLDPGSAQFREPFAQAFLENRIVIVESVAVSDPQDAWQVAAHDAGIRSGALLPIRRQGRAVGVLALNASEAHFFDQEMRALLEEMTTDIAFALGNFAYERRRTEAEQALKENEDRFRGLVEQAIAGIYIIEDDRLKYVNPRFAELFGYRPEELLGREAIAVVAEESRHAVTESLRRRQSGSERSVQYSFVGLRKDGSKFTVGAHGAAATIAGRPAVIGLVQDISEREQAQRQIAAYIQQLEASMLGTVHAVSKMVEMRDPYTAGHEERVGTLARAIGAEMGLPEETLRGLEIIGSVHDIGKISIPAEILSKPTRLTQLEYEIIKTHAQHGHDVFLKAEFPWPLAQTILQHHERMDGSGYPNGLKGDEILLEARILAVADTVEAMGTHRPYRPGLGIGKALEEIETFRGVRYCQRVVDGCLRLFREKGYELLN